jgi:hypothetical protein
MGWCPNFRALWPVPALGLDAIADSSKPLPYNGGNVYNQTIPRAMRGPEFQGAYSMQNYATGMDTHMTPSLARQMLYTWEDAQFNTGGPMYPNDYGFGPGFHGDCMSPQFYMRPGYVQPVQQGGRQL